MTKVVILCPVYEPYSAGGAQSFPLIVHVIAKITSLVVITEYCRFAPFLSSKSKSTLFRWLPPRDNLGSKTFIYSSISYIFSYFIIYLLLTFLFLFNFRILHFTRYTSPAFLPLLTVWKLFGGSVVYDCRTVPHLERETIQLQRILPLCDMLLANSLSSYNYLMAVSRQQENIHYLINPLSLPAESTLKYQPPNSLIASPFILSVGTVCSRKCSFSLAKVYDEICCADLDKNWPILIFIGRNDIGSTFAELVDSSPHLKYIPPLPHIEVLSYLSSSLGTINISSAEGIPRSSLESLYYKKPTLLPDCVPEFVDHCPNSIISSNFENHKTIIQNKIITMINNPEFLLQDNYNYPIHEHSLNAFQDSLLDIYNQLI